jgi:hypothetical protein
LGFRRIELSVAPSVAPTTGKNVAATGNGWQLLGDAIDPRLPELIALWTDASETERAAIFATAKAVTGKIRE